MDPKNLEQPVGQRLVTRWLEQVESAATLPHLPHGAWHMLRRKWTSERRDYAVEDIAAAGGWTSTQTLRDVYLQSDPVTRKRVIDTPTHVVHEQYS